jgi:hypothetical protein
MQSKIYFFALGTKSFITVLHINSWRKQSHYRQEDAPFWVAERPHFHMVVRSHQPTSGPSRLFQKCQTLIDRIDTSIAVSSGSLVEIIEEFLENSSDYHRFAVIPCIFFDREVRGTKRVSGDTSISQ